MFGISVEASGKKGGLAMFWRKQLDVRIQGFSENFIDAIIVEEVFTWRCTGIYGNPKAHLRQETWDMMRRLAAGNSYPWICLGDYNEVLYQWECRGGRPRHEAQINQFRKVVKDLAFNDLCSQGYPFTWARNWKRPASYRAKLDRALVNHQFLRIWRYSRTKHLDTNLSDHLPILVQKEMHFRREESKQKVGTQKRFRFEQMWITNPQVRELIANSWQRNQSPLSDKLEVCKNELLAWKKTFGNVFKEADTLRSKIAKLKYLDNGDGDEAEIAGLQNELELRLDQQEKLWQQRSGVLWLNSGDKNTNYFHTVASSRRRSNQITGLRDAEGNWVEEQTSLRNLIVGYFANLFEANELNQLLMREVLDRINTQLTETDSASLTVQFTNEEVKNAVFEMHPLKAPGPDGFNPQFFQQYWEIIGPELTNDVLKMLRESVIPKEMTQFCLAKPQLKKQLLSQISCISILLSPDRWLTNRNQAGPKLSFLQVSEIECLAKSMDGRRRLYQEQAKRNGDFMDAVPSAKASFSWRSILWARDYIKEGIMWGIGNETKVAWLIDEEAGVWKEELLNLFSWEDANSIRQIPLVSLEEEDFPRWPFTKHGSYSVKSGYHYIQYQKNVKEAQCSGSNQGNTQRPLWKKLWSLKIPPKVKIFCWRLMLNALPCYENLRKRRIQCENWCPLCSADDASLQHLFGNCPVATQVWALSYLERQVRPHDFTNITEWVRYVLDHCSIEVVEKFCILLWALWKNRNDICFGGSRVDPLRMTQNALKFWHEYKEANKIENFVNQENEAVKWVPPLSGYWKVNVDAACDGNGRNGVGMIVRDAYGNLIFAKAQHVPHWKDAATLEAFAIKMACEWCKETKMTKVWIESDAQTIIKMIQQKNESRDYSGLFVKEISKLAKGEDYSFCWCPRSANGAAHLLANYAKVHSGSYWWHTEAPHFLSEILVQEMNLL